MIDASLASRAALDELFELAYAELRRLAAQLRQREPHATMSPTTLVSAAWLKLAGTPAVAGLSFLHFKHIAGRAMRQVLVEAACARLAAKRGASPAATVALDESRDSVVFTSREMVTLDGALDDLAKVNPRQARMVELRFFGGLDVAETAHVLGVSEATVMRDWRVARAWLAGELRRH